MSEAVELQRALHAEAFRRLKAIAAAPAPVLPGNVESLSASTEDAVLSWAGGPPVVSPSGPRDIPFSPSMQSVAGIGGEAEHRAPRTTGVVSGVDAIAAHTSVKG